MEEQGVREWCFESPSSLLTVGRTWLAAVGAVALFCYSTMSDRGNRMKLIVTFNPINVGIQWCMEKPLAEHSNPAAVVTVSETDHPAQLAVWVGMYSGDV